MYLNPITVRMLAREHQRRLMTDAQNSRARRHLRNGRRSP
jgi:hypothetical protein